MEGEALIGYRSSEGKFRRDVKVGQCTYHGEKLKGQIYSQQVCSLKVLD